MTSRASDFNLHYSASVDGSALPVWRRAASVSPSSVVKKISGAPEKNYCPESAAAHHPLGWCRYGLSDFPAAAFFMCAPAPGAPGLAERLYGRGRPPVSATGAGGA